MVRRLMVRGSAAAALALAIAVVASPSASATTTSLLLPQGAAFSILGRSCGGIQEKAYATGFDTASGYPTGVVYLSTSCGGSGRGGGYRSTTYSAWAGVSWDFTGAVISYTRLSAAPTVNPTFSAVDAHGNRVYNQSNSAYLVLAPGFVPTARVTSVSPASGPTTGGTTMAITGAGFTGATGVNFGAAAAATFTVNSATSITATSPAASAGTVDVTVANSGGTSAPSASDQFMFVAAPTVSGVSPNFGPVGGGTSVTITGAHLSGATRVDFGGTATGFWVNSDTSITAYSPAGESADAVDVRVTTIGGRSARSAADRFSYKVTPPTLASVSPNLGPQDGGTEVTITGTNLTYATAVDFGGVAAGFWVNSDTSITAFTPAASAGTVDVTVTTLDGTSATSAGDQFTFVAAPSVSGLSPNAGPVDGGTVVTITGTGFTGASAVDFGGIAASFVVNSDTSITAFSPAGTAATVDVTVTTAGGTSATSASDLFSYVAAPTVSSVDPNTGPVAGGTAVTITGTGFTGASAVDFGGIGASFVVNSDTSITAFSPAGTAATVDVTVTTVGGASAASASDQFTYV
jgi:large repetitive protein